MTTFIAIYISPKEGTKVFKSRKYQSDAYTTFMNSKKDEMEFNYNNNIKFKLLKFDSTPFNNNYIIFVF